MKKLQFVIVVFAIALLLSACGAAERKILSEAPAPVSTAAPEIVENHGESQQETPVPVEVPVETPVPEPEVPEEPSADESSGIRPEFKEAMDSYVDFFEEYAAFMKKFQSNSTDINLLLGYTQYLAQYADTMDKLEAVDQADLTKEELAYYLDTMVQVEKLLLDAMA